MSALDAEFLHAERGPHHLHIGACAVFEGPVPAADRLDDLIRNALPSIPRYRQRVQAVPLQLGRPVWVDDDGFDLRHHVFHVVAPRPGSDAELQVLVGELMSQPLDRSRPLWEMWIVDGLADGRWAMVAKVHHCMVDGIAGVGLLELIFSVEPTPIPDVVADGWTPEARPTDTQLLLDAVGQVGVAAAGTARGLLGALARPRDTFESLGALAGGARAWARDVRATPPSAIEGSVGDRRTWTWARASLADAKAIRAAHGGTVNDVILTAITRGFREVLLAHGEDPAASEVRTIVPVSVRHTSGVLDNEVAALLAQLPVALEDPVARLAAVRQELDGLKSAHEAELVEALTGVGNLVPAPLLAYGTWAAVEVMHRRPQRHISTVTTNVPGPQLPLYADGCRLLEYLPYVPVAFGVRLTVAIVSYDGKLAFGITGDHHTAPDVPVLAAGIEAGIAELLDGLPTDV